MIQRETLFNIFYMGINLGSFGALFIASWLKNNYGYGAPFYSSMVVSAFMICLLLIGFRLLNKHIIEFKLTLAIVIKVALLLTVYIIVLFYIFEQLVIANLSIFIAVITSMLILGVSIKNLVIKKFLLRGYFSCYRLYTGAYIFKSL